MRIPRVDRKLEHANAVIGEIVRDIRKHRNLNQTEVCKAIGLDQSALSRVESGKQQLTAAQWVLFCRKLRIKADLITMVNQEMSA